MFLEQKQYDLIKTVFNYQCSKGYSDNDIKQPFEHLLYRSIAVLNTSKTCQGKMWKDLMKQS